LRSARRGSHRTCRKPLLVLYVKDKYYTTCGDKYGRRCNYFNYRNSSHNDHAFVDRSPPTNQLCADFFGASSVSEWIVGKLC
jgi:hypothetical protein